MLPCFLGLNQHLQRGINEFWGTLWTCTLCCVIGVQLRHRQFWFIYMKRLPLSLSLVSCFVCLSCKTWFMGSLSQFISTSSSLDLVLSWFNPSLSWICFDCIFKIYSYFLRCKNCVIALRAVRAKSYYYFHLVAMETSWDKTHFHNYKTKMTLYSYRSGCQNKGVTPYVLYVDEVWVEL